MVRVRSGWFFAGSMVTGVVMWSSTHFYTQAPALPVSSASLTRVVFVTAPEREPGLPVLDQLPEGEVRLLAEQMAWRMQKRYGTAEFGYADGCLTVSTPAVIVKDGQEVVTVVLASDGPEGVTFEVQRRHAVARMPSVTRDLILLMENWTLHRLVARRKLTRTVERLAGGVERHTFRLQRPLDNKVSPATPKAAR